MKAQIKEINDLNKNHIVQIRINIMTSKSKNNKVIKEK